MRRAWVVGALGAVVACLSACSAHSSLARPTTAVTSGGGELRSFAALQDVVRESGARSIDALLPALPAELRSRFVLLYESRSLQSASYDRPRVILYSPGATLVLAYNGGPGERGGDELETMEFDSAARAFRFREISFRAQGPEGKGAVVSEPNPPKCLACHRDDPLPIWDAYPTWPGVYGEQEFAPPAPDEAVRLRSFLCERRASPRYRPLANAESLAKPPSRDDVAAYEGREHLSHNAEFGLLLQTLAYRAIAREVSRAPGFDRFRYALLAALDTQCVGIDRFLPGETRARFRRSLEDFERETQGANAERDAEKARRLHESDDRPSWIPRETLTAFRYLVEEGLGLSTKRWGLALEEATYDFTSPRPATRVLERDLLDAVARADPAIVSLRGANDPRQDYCAALRKRSLADH